MIGLGIGLSLGRVGVSSVDPIAALFSSGEQGIWLDAIEPTLMFQDALGTTPVTTPGQPVGLLLDKSKSGGRTLAQVLASQPELVTNGGFDTDLSGWTLGSDPNNVTASWNNGTAVVARGTGGISGFSQSIPNAMNKTVQVEMEMLSGAVAINLGGQTTSGISGGLVKRILPFGGVPDFQIWPQSNNSSATIGRISFKEVPGGHARQTTNGSRPTFAQDAGGRYYLNSDLVDDALPATIPSLGSNATVWFATGTATTILTGQTVPAGSFAALRGQRTYAVGAVNRALTPAETSSLTQYLNAARGA